MPSFRKTWCASPDPVFTVNKRSWSPWFEILICNALKFEFDFLWNSNLNFFQIRIWPDSNLTFFEIRIWTSFKFEFDRKPCFIFIMDGGMQQQAAVGIRNLNNSWRCKAKGWTNTIRSGLKGRHGLMAEDAQSNKFPMIQKTLQSNLVPENLKRQ